MADGLAEGLLCGGGLCLGLTAAVLVCRRRLERPLGLAVCFLCTLFSVWMLLLLQDGGTGATPAGAAADVFPPLMLAVAAALVVYLLATRGAAGRPSCAFLTATRAEQHVELQSSAGDDGL